jgi:hypothetical protein
VHQLVDLRVTDVRAETKLVLDGLGGRRARDEVEDPVAEPEMRG